MPRKKRAKKKSHGSAGMSSAGFDASSGGHVRGPASIQSTVYGFFERKGRRETPGYGRYSYVVVLHRDARAKVLAAAILTSVAEQDTTLTPPSQLNLLEFPVRHGFWASADGRALRDGGIADTLVTSLVDTYYDSGLARDVMEATCRDQAVATRFCRDHESRGPYLVTFPHRISDAPTLNPPFLVVDLGPVDPAAFSYFLDAFTRQVKSPTLSDRSKIDTFRTFLLVHVLDTADWLPPTISAIPRLAEAK